MRLRLFLIISIFFLIISAWSAQAADITLQYAPPCLLPDQFAACPDVSDSIAGYLLRLYNFALGIIGTLAFGTIVVGGIYIAFSGVADKKKEGKEMITSALWGIAILLGSYLILNTINPEIPKLKEPGLQPVTLGQLAIESPAPSENNMIVCGQLNKDGGQVIPESACANNEWPFITVKDGGVSGAKNPQTGDQLGWTCKDPFSSPSGAPSGTAWQACLPASFASMKENNFRAYIAFFADGNRDFKEKAANNSCSNCVALDNSLPIKQNTSCQIGPNGDMTSCVCTWNTKDSPACQSKNAINEKLLDLKESYGTQGISWNITEAYPPTVMHSAVCHFNGGCVDISISQGDNCALVEQAKTIASSIGFAVLNEYPACQGTSTEHATGGHLHLSL